MTSLKSLYAQHHGKVTDKWSHYLEIYDDLLSRYRQAPVNLLEIGIQNGGSLDVWSRYFPNGQHFVGCDINPRCGDLRYDDARIEVVIGDATNALVAQIVKSKCKQFDIIIDDGSHTSADVIQTFFKYFDSLAEGGVFIFEDLHCSYWQEYEGGISYPYSSINFFKAIADVVNDEHWGNGRSAEDLLQPFLSHYAIQTDGLDYSTILSVEFFNSTCVLKKTGVNGNRLGTRVAAGSQELAFEGILKLAGSPAYSLPQTGNKWAQLPVWPAVESSSGFEAPLTHDLIISQENLAPQRLAKLVRILDHQMKVLQTQLDQQTHAMGVLEQEKAALQISNHINYTALQAIRTSRLWPYFNRVQAILRKIRRQFKTSVQADSSDVQEPLINSGHRDTDHEQASMRSIAPQVDAKKKASELTLDERKQLHCEALSHRVSHPPEIGYLTWRQKQLQHTPHQSVDRARKIAGLRSAPLISVIIPAFNSNLSWIREAVASVVAQSYPFWELCIADDASDQPEVQAYLESLPFLDHRIKVVFRAKNGHISATSNSAIEVSTGHWIGFLDHDDVLDQDALYWVVDALNRTPDARLIYSDEDKINEQGVLTDPYFKPDWNLDLFYSHNFFSHFGLVHRELLRQVGGFRAGFEGAQDYDLVLRCLEKVDHSQIVHIPRVLYHWRIHNQSTAGSNESKPYALQAGLRALSEHFSRLGIDATVTTIEELNFYRVTYALPANPPDVTVVIPSKNNYRLLHQCVESILALTLYPRYSLLIVDNGSTDDQVLQYLQELPRRTPRVQVVRDDQVFNYAAINNQAIANVTTEFVCLLNDDIEVISPDWLDEMVSVALQDGVGCVGAKLYYPDDTIQHAGVLLGMGGVAGHMFGHFPKWHPGYFGRARLRQSLSAVTAACLLVRRSIYNAVGGLDAVNLKVAFNDVDFCLKVREAGHRNVWTPFAELYHFESASRGYEDTPEKQARFKTEAEFMYAKWGELLQNDPAYNPNLSLGREDFGLALESRIDP